MPEKTSIETGLGLADEGGNEDAAAWVSRMKKSGNKKKKQQQEVAKKAMEFDDMDEQATKEDVAAASMRVAHSTDTIGAGTEHVLTLQDSRIVDESGKFADTDDVLESTELVEDEKREFYKKRAKGFDKYDDEQNESILAQYDEGRREFAKGRKSFTLDEHGGLDALQLSSEEQKRLDALAADKGMTRYSLGGDDTKDFMWNTLQRDTYTEQEMTQFKKPKRKRVLKKKNKEVVTERMKELRLEVQENEELEAARTHRIREEPEQSDALAKLEVREKAFALTTEAKAATEQQITSISETSLSTLKEGNTEAWQPDEAEEKDDTVYIDATSEFIKQIETKVQVKEDPKTMEVDEEDEETPEAKEKKAEKQAKFEERVKNANLIKEEGLGTMASAMAFIQQKGLIGTSYIGRENDGILEEDNDGLVIKRKDQFGRDVTPHEAFRQQSRVFHGKNPSKNRVQKSEKRWEELDKMRRMSEKDALAGLRTAQETSGKAGIVLQGGMKEQLNQIHSDIVGNKRGLDSTVSSASIMSKRPRPE